MKLEEAKLCMKCGEVFNVPTPGKCPCCNEDSWIWILGFIKEGLKDELFQVGVLYTTTSTEMLEWQEVADD